MSLDAERPAPELQQAGIDIPGLDRRLVEAPWWFFALLAILAYLGYLVFFDPDYAGAKEAVLQGIPVTIRSTLIGFSLALIIGLIAGLGRISRNVVLRNVATLYVEFIRGVPILVLIFTVALVIVPLVSDSLGVANRMSQEARAIIALAIIYGAYIAEVFRAGVESVPPGQMEAGRSLGMRHGTAMRVVVLPQAVRNVLPALGNDFIAMLKDSSLLSVLGVREITQMGRLYANSSFQFREAFLAMTFLYLFFTLILSLAVQWYARRLKRG
jgi:polar amino acid transport system permease protein